MEVIWSRTARQPARIVTNYIMFYKVIKVSLMLLYAAACWTEAAIQAAPQAAMETSISPLLTPSLLPRSGAFEAVFVPKNPQSVARYQIAYDFTSGACYRMGRAEMHLRTKQGACYWGDPLHPQDIVQKNGCDPGDISTLDSWTPAAFLAFAAQRPELFSTEMHDGERALNGQFILGVRALSVNPEWTDHPKVALWLAFSRNEELPTSLVQGWPNVLIRYEYIWGTDKTRLRALVPDQVATSESHWVLASFLWHENPPSDLFSYPRVLKVATEVAARVESEVMAGRRDGLPSTVVGSVSRPETIPVEDKVANEGSRDLPARMARKAPVDWPILYLGAILIAAGVLAWWHRRSTI